MRGPQNARFWRSGVQVPRCYNPCVFRSLTVSVLLTALHALGQQAPSQQQPQVKLNYLNVCTPSTDEQDTLKGALSRVSGTPVFADDFELARGRATPNDSPPSRFVRLRRDFAPKSPMMTAQYSMSIDEKALIETLVLRMRDPKDFHEISIEDRVSAAAVSPVTLIATDTPAARIRLERLGKGSVVLARCDAADQSVYGPLFKQASELIARYRAALGLRTTFRSDIAWLTGAKRTTDRSAARPKTQP
jgi:hypothetical protein